jgi:hypothetical protein
VQSGPRIGPAGFGCRTISLNQVQDVKIPIMTDIGKPSTASNLCKRENQLFSLFRGLSLSLPPTHSPLSTAYCTTVHQGSSCRLHCDFKVVHQRRAEIGKMSVANTGENKDSLYLGFGHAVRSWLWSGYLSLSDSASTAASQPLCFRQHAKKSLS